MSSKRATQSRLSVNKLGEYIAARPGRQNKILYDAKYPQDFVVSYYREASESIAQSICDGLTSIAGLETTIKRLGGSNPDTIYETRRLSGNIDAIETFMDLMREINLRGAEPKLGSHKAEPLVFHGVEISVRPEVTLHSHKRNGAALVGGVKLHFPKSYPLPDEAAEYISACVQMYFRDHLTCFGEPSHEHCFVIDVAGARAFSGVKAVKSRMRDVEEACRQISSIWPSI